MAEDRSNPLSALSEELVRLSANAGVRVVSLNSRGGFPTSGTIWEQGFVVTADHVLHTDSGLRVRFDDGSEADAELAGRDPSRDLALLKVETPIGGFVSTVDPNALRPGTLAVAVSRNSEGTLNSSLAVVNAIGGEWRAPFGGTIDRHVRIDVALHAGFSGGPLVDTRGGLIGINSSRLSRRAPVALPVSTVDRVVKELKEHGHISQGYLGVATFPVAVDEALRTRLKLESAEGLIVVQIEKGSGAEQGGMVQGDILLSLNGERVSDPEELQGLLSSESVGTKVRARVLRGGSLVDLELAVGERPVRRSGGEWGPHWGRGHHRGHPRRPHRGR